MKKYALLGENIGYSLSPFIHSAIYDYFGIYAQYVLADTEHTPLADTISILKTFDGFNVTKPYKNKIKDYLGDCMGCESVNTVKKYDNGLLIGFNTDAVGLKKALLRNRIFCEGKDVLLLGAGGAAAAAFGYLLESGSNLIEIYNRTQKKAEELIKNKKAYIYDSMRPHIIINASSAGYNGQSPMPPDADLSRLECVYDLSYSPSETLFMKEMRGHCDKIYNGLDMLIYQAIMADRILLGINNFNEDELFNYILEKIADRIK